MEKQELHHLLCLGIVSDDQCQSIEQFRDLYIESIQGQKEDMLNNAYYSLMFELVSTEIIKPLNGLIMTYNASMQNMLNQDHVQESKKSWQDKLWHSSYHMLGKTKNGEFDGLPDHGLLSRIALDCIANHHHFPDADTSTLPSILEHCESPLQKMARTGLDLLSKGLGR